ncbi:VOC family protein [Mycolicibacterium sp. 120266]|uniref:VOC family protein n=1 Tax=Mycolicibacterium sp. 120266 TaxID=3090601 RepID=UPI00299D571E|nr:VOC family protein [Mycolicibacterium sp. 120266]MDX1872079.1 VOC family protein [Mycolicibacterium sp. 120266]
MSESFRIGLSEVVLRTPYYERLCWFYSEVLRRPPTLDMTPAGGVDTTDPDTPTRIAFFQLPGGFPYTQRIAVFECADVGGTDRRSVGLHHLQVRYPDLERLHGQYRHLKALGELPIEAANHGVASSLYYRDPDGNKVELSGMNFATEEEMGTFMQSEDFQRNPDGHKIDPEEYFAPGGEAAGYSGVRR